MSSVFVTTSWDDGHVQDIKVAELLRRYGIAGTFYVAPWDHEFDRHERMDDKQIAALAKNFEIGAHTMTHPRLPQLEDATAYQEMAESRDYLQRVTRQAVTSFCYPGGAYRRQHRAMAARLGFTYARSIRRFWFGRPDDALAAATSVHAYRHWSDGWRILRFARFNPVRFVRYQWSWDALAIAMFEQTKARGGVFHLWGHSWEIDRNGDWERLEHVLSHLSGQKQVEYVENKALAPSKQPSVLITAPYFYPHIGGLENYVLQLALKFQREQGMRVVVVTTTEPGQRPGVYEELGLTVYRMRARFKIGNTGWSPTWARQLRRIIAQEQPDIISTHAPVPGMAESTILAAGKRPVALTWHAGSMEKGQWAFDIAAWVYERTLLTWLRHRSAAVICNSEFVRETVMAGADLPIVWPGVDLERFIPAPKLARNTVLFVGNLNHSDQYKGVSQIIQAMAELKKDLPEIKLIVVGDGNHRELYEAEAAAAGVTATFTGALHGNDLVNTFQSATVYAYPVTNDSYPTTVLEAMASSLPVISTHTGDIPTMVQDGITGRLVRDREAGLSAALREYLGDYKLAQKHGAAGAVWAREQASWSMRAKTMKALLEAALQPKILQVTPYYPPHVGGMENVVRELSAVLREQGQQVEVITSKLGAGSGAAAYAGVDDSAYVRRLFALDILRTPIMPGLFLSIVRQPKRSVVHMHVAQALVPEVTLLAAKLRGFPIIAHVHLDVGASGVVGRLIFGPYKRVFLSRVLRACDRVVVLSEDQRELMIRLYRLDSWRVLVIPNGVADRFFMDVRETAHQPLRLLNVGRLAVQKRLERMVEATAECGDAVQLDLVGDGEERATLEAKASELAASNIAFHGYKYGDELLDYYKQADVYIMTSDKEGLPLVLLEAMAAGLPVIGSDVMGIREHLRGVGLLVADLTPAGFAKAIKAFIAAGTEEYARLSRRSLKAAKRYSWNLLAERVNALYREVEL